jgi:hypothetical protein
MKAIISLILICGVLNARAQGTAFSYQGRLVLGGAPASGNWDVQFKLYDAATGTNQVGSTVTKINVPVNTGLFSTTLDFGEVFDGNSRWLDIAARTNGSAGGYTNLTPRVAILPVPYAVKSATAATVDDGAISFNKLAARQVGTNVGAGGVAVSTSSGNFISPTPTIPTLISNFSLTITTLGNPVEISFFPDGSPNPGYFYIQRPTSPYIYLELVRDNTSVASQDNGLSSGSSVAGMDVSPNHFRFLDFPTAGQHTYQVKFKADINTVALGALYMKMVAREQ